ncbi:MAG: glutamate--cysteine ligase, partial [Gammaproteobacteria bacterium]
SSRFRALNEQVLLMRGNAPISLDIHGREHLDTTHHDVMLEAAATSFQIHLQVAQEQAVRMFNAALIVSAPLVAISANAPYLFGRDLWDESRIPLFEQAVDVGRDGNKRVTFGNDYVRGTLFSCFEENLEHYPVLLPLNTEDDPARFHHLRMHNGTIWRWNRPLIDFDPDGTPHIRIENRVIPAGPTIQDMIANAVFFWGAIQILATLSEAPEFKIPFPVTKQNFYNVARYSLQATIQWLDGELTPVRDILMNDLLPMSRKGLERMQIDTNDIDHYLGILEARVTSGRNGATWQRNWVQQHGADMDALSREYMQRQQTEVPVHEWDV